MFARIGQQSLGILGVDRERWGCRDDTSASKRLLNDRGWAEDRVQCVTNLKDRESAIAHRSSCNIANCEMKVYNRSRDPWLFRQEVHNRPSTTLNTIPNTVKKDSHRMIVNPKRNSVWPRPKHAGSERQALQDLPIRHWPEPNRKEHRKKKPNWSVSAHDLSDPELL
jgi:hypothetical protein